MGAKPFMTINSMHGDRTSLIEMHKLWSDCHECKLGTTATCHVLGRGEFPCEVIFIGEGPGQSEDATGYPFVGKAGKLLDHWIGNARYTNPFSYAVTNLVACRPTDEEGRNRPPSADEIYHCQPRLSHFIEMCCADGVVLLGRVAQVQVPWLQKNFSELRLLYLPHPAYVLRLGGKKSDASGKAIRDLRSFIELIGKPDER